MLMMISIAASPVPLCPIHSDSPSATTDLRGLELLQQAGRGGQGVVYRGRLHGLPVAVKVIPVAEGERSGLPCSAPDASTWGT